MDLIPKSILANLRIKIKFTYLIPSTVFRIYLFKLQHIFEKLSSNYLITYLFIHLFIKR